MKKRVIRVFLIIFVLALCVGALVACNDKKTTTPTISYIYMWEQPKNYYAVDEAFSAADGEICVVYSDGSKVYVSLLSDEIKLTNIGGTAREDTLYTVGVEYKGFKTSFRYYVCKSGALIESVELTLI